MDELVGKTEGETSKRSTGGNDARPRPASPREEKECD